MKPIPKPQLGEYAPYATMYIGLLPDDGLVLQHLKNNLQTTCDLIRSLPEETLLFRYAPGKWTIKEILVHISDDERIYAYRALRFARNDKTELPGFEQDDYALASGANERTVDDILEELASVREATITLFKNLDEAALLRSGVANGTVMSVRAAAYHIAGHEMHHVNLIKERLSEAPGAMTAILADRTVGVLGSGSEEHTALAEEVGALLARLGVNLLTGAGSGVMTSVSRAFTQAPRARGICIGIVPCSADDPAVPKKGYPNPFVELPIYTHLSKSGEEGTSDLSRNHINVLSSAVLIALPGGAGTGSEVDLALRYGKPVIVYAPNERLVRAFPSGTRRAATIQEVEDFLRPLIVNGPHGEASSSGRCSPT